MKKFLIALSLIATPVTAEARHRDSNQRSEPSSKTEKIIGALIVGAIIGSAVSGSRDRHYDEEREPYYRDRVRRVCFKEQIVEYRYGRRYIRYEYRCR